MHRRIQSALRTTGLLCSVSVVLTGCSLYDRQPPAPVYQNRPTVYSEPAPIAPPTPKPPEPVSQAPDIVQTQPLEMPEEPITTPLEPIPEPTPSETPIPATSPNAQSTPGGETAATNPFDLLPGSPIQPAPLIVPPVEAPAPPPPPAPMAFEPLQAFGSMSPAVGALMIAANKDSQKGSYENATTTLERAIRIEPRNAALYYKLAVIKLAQSKPGLAEDLAKKALSLVGKDNQLKKHCWLLIAKARDLQKDPAGAKTALEKAEKL